MKRFGLNILSVAVFCFGIGFPVMTFASVFGMSPGKITLESLPNQTQSLFFTITRSNPSTEDTLSVSAGGTGAESIHLDGGTVLVMPKGKESVAYPFTLNTTGLEIGHTYQPTISFINVRTEPGVLDGANQVQVGVTGKVDLKIVEKLTPLIEPRNLSRETVIPHEVYPVGMRVKNGKKSLGKVIQWEMVNQLSEPVQGIPFAITVFSGTKQISFERGIISQKIDPNGRVTESFNESFLHTGMYRIELSVGNRIVKKSVFVYDTSFGLEPILHQPLIPFGLFIFGLCIFGLGRMQNKNEGKRFRILNSASIGIISIGVLWTAGLYVTLGRLQTVPLQDLHIQQDAFFLVKSSGEKQFFNLQNGQAQGLNGSWKIFAANNEDFFVFPTDEKTKELTKQRFYLMRYDGITGSDLTQFSGTVESVEENREHSYVLLNGRDAHQKPFYCLAEVRATNGMNCLWMNQQIQKDVVAAHFSSENSHEVVLQTQDGFFVYDIWMQTSASVALTAFPKGVVFSAAQDVLQPVWKRNDFCTFLFPAGRFLTAPQSLFKKITPTLYLEERIEHAQKNIYVIDEQKRQKAFLASVHENDQLFFLEKGSFITSP